MKLKIEKDPKVKRPAETVIDEKDFTPAQKKEAEKVRKYFDREAYKALREKIQRESKSNLMQNITWKQIDKEGENILISGMVKLKDKEIIDFTLLTDVMTGHEKPKATVKNVIYLFYVLHSNNLIDADFLYKEKSRNKQVQWKYETIAQSFRPHDKDKYRDGALRDGRNDYFPNSGDKTNDDELIKVISECFK